MKHELLEQTIRGLVEGDVGNKIIQTDVNTDKVVREILGEEILQQTINDILLAVHEELGIVKH